MRTLRIWRCLLGLVTILASFLSVVNVQADASYDNCGQRTEVTVSGYSGAWTTTDPATDGITQVVTTATGHVDLVARTLIESAAPYTLSVSKNTWTCNFKGTMSQGQRQSLLEGLKPAKYLWIGSDGSIETYEDYPLSVGTWTPEPSETASPSLTATFTYTATPSVAVDTSTATSTATPLTEPTHVASQLVYLPLVFKMPKIILTATPTATSTLQPTTIVPSATPGPYKEGDCGQIAHVSVPRKWQGARTTSDGQTVHLLSGDISVTGRFLLISESPYTLDTGDNTWTCFWNSPGGVSDDEIETLISGMLPGRVIVVDNAGNVVSDHTYDEPPMAPTETPTPANTNPARFVTPDNNP